MNVRDIFNAAATGYDAARPRLIPPFDEFYGTALELIPFEPNAQFSVLDLGAGTGLFAAILNEAFPNAHYTLSDIAPAMLDIARQRFINEGDRFQFRVEDYGTQPLAGKFDVVVSALSLHHTAPLELGGVFRKIFATLNPGGIFINADQTLGVSAENESKIAAMWEKGCREKGSSEEDLIMARKRMEADRTVPLEAQLEWMRQAGFMDVECWFKSWRFAVYSGRVTI